MYNQAALEVRKIDSASLVKGKPYSTRSREDSMKYMISWNERPQGSPAEYEKAQTRILEVFGQWKAPANFKIEFFVIRVGDWGGYLLVDCDEPFTLHKFCSMLPAFAFALPSLLPAPPAAR